MDKSIKELHEKITSCNKEYPYAFVSYSSKDCTRVWKDVNILQDKGYNIWIDKNLKLTDDSWKKALEAIEHINCKLVIFYISKNSVTSDPCFQELEKRMEDRAKRIHNGEVPLLVIEAEPIKDIQMFRNATHEYFSNSKELSATEKMEKLDTLGKMMDKFFPDNDKLRIVYDEDERISDYYSSIEKYLTSIKKFSVDELLRSFVRDLSDESKQSNVIEQIIKYDKEDNVLSTILLSFLMREGIYIKKDIEMAKEKMDWVTFTQDPNTWLSKAQECKKEQDFEYAALWFLGHAMNYNDASAYLEALKLWTKTLKNYDVSLACAEKVIEIDSSNEDIKKFKGYLIEKGKDIFKIMFGEL